MPDRFSLNPEVYERVLEVAPGWCKYHIEERWHAWLKEKNFGVPDNPEAAFLGFARKFYEKHGPPR